MCLQCYNLKTIVTYIATVNLFVFFLFVLHRWGCSARAVVGRAGPPAPHQPGTMATPETSHCPQEKSSQHDPLSAGLRDMRKAVALPFILP